MRTNEAYYLTTYEIKEYLEKSDLAILSVGCFEMHGEHGPMGVDTIVDDAFSRMLAKKVDALVFPPIHYAFTGATGPFWGSVSISPEATADYLKNVIKSMIKSGFRKIVVVGGHGPHGIVIPFVIRSIFEENCAAVTHMTPYSYLTEEDFIKVWGKYTYWHEENSLLLGAAKYLGMEQLIDPSKWVTKDNDGVPHPALKEMRRNKLHTPYHYDEPNQHLPPVGGLDFEGGLKILELTVERAAKALENLPAWAEFTAKQRLQEEIRMKKR